MEATMADDFPVPSPNPATARYWAAATQHQLSLPRCVDCGKHHSYPRSACPFCFSTRLEWHQCSGKGTIFTYTEIFRAPSKAFAADLPYVVAIIALDEGPHLMTRLIRDSGEEPRIGQRVTVVFQDLDEEISLPMFKVDPQ
jgi:uncharacterized OB-fold protein